MIKDCNTLYKISERKDKNIYNLFALFINGKSWLKLANSIIDKDTTIKEYWKYIENIMKKLNNNKWDSFEILVWEWYEWIWWFFLEK